jgi:hypothetical protein
LFGGVVLDTYLPFTVHLLYVLRRHFARFSLQKPNQSRPANSERYVVCAGFLREKPAVLSYLFLLNDLMNGGDSGSFGPTKSVGGGSSGGAAVASNQKAISFRSGGLVQGEGQTGAAVGGAPGAPSPSSPLAASSGASAEEEERTTRSFSRTWKKKWLVGAVPSHILQEDQSFLQYIFFSVLLCADFPNNHRVRTKSLFPDIFALSTTSSLPANSTLSAS